MPSSSKRRATPPLDGVDSNLEHRQDAADNPPPQRSAKNAFQELMAPKQKPALAVAKRPSSPRKVFKHRDNLGQYIHTPETNSRVVYYTDDWVVIKDAFPKSAVHLLLLPRHRHQYRAHPYDAFRDPEFLASAKEELEKVKGIVASELRRQFGKYSATEKARIDAMNMDEPPEVLPPGRDWTIGLRTGIHANPSMNHLHIHCLSPDLVSPCTNRRPHYNSHTTRFLVPLEDFPKEVGDDSIRDEASKILHQDLKCWRCGRNFGNKMARLKEHLEEELMEWAKE
ncbi:HIT-like protein [Tothia fuscella]|uniref:HIT-like protein n=1 Tax=Tothia fuscella TaxID=1048955 RepID=A0A9P4U1N2_9PEZI|nr:HIT-like protein [Tothia fuscella]